MLSTSCLCVMFSLFVQSMEFPVRCRLRTLPTWCSTRLTSMEMVRPTLWISKPQPNLISKLQWRIWTQLVCLYLLSRWTVLWRVHGGGSEWRNAAEDTNWEFGPFTHCPKDSRRDDGQQLIFPEICLFYCCTKPVGSGQLTNQDADMWISVKGSMLVLASWGRRRKFRICQHISVQAHLLFCNWMRHCTWSIHVYPSAIFTMNISHHITSDCNVFSAQAESPLTLPTCSVL